MKQNNHSSWWINDNDPGKLKITEYKIKAYESLKKWMARQNRKTKEAEWFEY